MTSTDELPMMANTICYTISPMASPFLVAILGAYACANRKVPKHRVVDGQGHSHIAVRQHHAVQRVGSACSSSRSSRTMPRRSCD